MQVAEYVPVSKIENTNICGKEIKNDRKIIQGTMKDFHAENKLVFLLNKFSTVTFKKVVLQGRFYGATSNLLKVIQNFASLPGS